MPQEVHLKLIEVIAHCCDVKSFRFEVKEDVSYKPGQYLVLTLEIGGKPQSKAFSISSSPTEKGYIEFTKKISKSDFSQALDRLEIGRSYSLRFPLGRFTFEGEHEKVAFLSGGIGVTPIRSIFKNASDKQIPADMILLYSSRTPDYLIFRSDFELMGRAHHRLNIIYTLTHCDERVQGCRVGYINAEMVKKEVPDYAQRVFYICGPPGMVQAMRQMLLTKLFVSQEKIVTEDFVGY